MLDRLGLAAPPSRDALSLDAYAAKLKAEDRA